jgi:hypothetical protein
MQLPRSEDACGGALFCDADRSSQASQHPLWGREHQHTVPLVKIQARCPSWRRFRCTATVAAQLTWSLMTFHSSGILSQHSLANAWLPTRGAPNVYTYF